MGEIELPREQVHAGEHISSICHKAAALANNMSEAVVFNFNDVPVTAHPGDLQADVEKRWWITQRLMGYGL